MNGFIKTYGNRDDIHWSTGNVQAATLMETFGAFVKQFGPLKGEQILQDVIEIGGIVYARQIEGE